MRGFRPAAGTAVVAEFEPVESALLSQLAGQVADLLDAAGTDAAVLDPAIARMLPDAYIDDAEASAEFRRFTAGELTTRKIRNVRTIATDMSHAVSAEGPTAVELDAQSTQAWLRGLTDIRLVLAARLHIDEHGESDRNDDESVMLNDVYDWLGWVQGSLVEAVDR